MTFTPASLYASFLANAKATIYTPPAGKIVVIDYISVSNDSAATAYTFNLYLKRSGGSSARIIGKNTAIPASGTVDGMIGKYRIILSNGDILEGDDNGNGGAVVFVVVCGMVQD